MWVRLDLFHGAIFFILKIVSVKIIPEDIFQGACSTWHVMCARAINNRRSEQIYTVTINPPLQYNNRICGNVYISTITRKPTNLEGMWLTIRSWHPLNHVTLWSRNLAVSSDKLKPLYLHYNSAYGHQIWKNGDLLWGALSHKLI